jgi:putative PIN family toxin of toxin-antitoxin system
MIVLDTNVLVSALRSSKGYSRLIVQDVLTGQLQMGVSVPLFLEYEAVLTRADQLEAFGLSATEVTDFLDGLASVMQPVDLSFLWRPQLRDPADEMVLETAVNGAASHLLTWNTRDFLPAVQQFDLQLQTPEQFCKRLKRLPAH